MARLFLLLFLSVLPFFLYFSVSVRKGIELVDMSIKAWMCSVRLCSLCYLNFYFNFQATTRCITKMKSMYHIICVLDSNLVPVFVLFNQSMTLSTYLDLLSFFPWIATITRTEEISYWICIIGLRVDRCLSWWAKYEFFNPSGFQCVSVEWLTTL